MKANYGKKSACSQALKLLLKAQIKELHSEFINNEYITTADLDEMEAIYLVYHEGLGGNGTATKMMNDIRSKPIKEE